MKTPEPFQLPDVSERQRTRLLRHALKLLDAQRKMSMPNGRNIIHYTLQSERQPLRMAHYPKGDRIDYNSGAQYFYHCHRENLKRQEHGHFHCFLRAAGIPDRIRPKPLPDWDKHIDSPMAHIVAVAMNRYGWPIRLFTVNRWVSAETWYAGRHTPAFVRKFKFEGDDDHWGVLDSWMESMLQLFAPQIAWLSQQRDETIARWQRAHPDKNAYEARRLEELSELPVNLNAQVRWLTGR
jgi:hypothetical protein